ncbi:DUF4129 domain-containing protein [Ovoidimarina sediminis]|uniref:DUF4129 domain-containing protein n=1 Tax=Ovoidimarina sediminis TaxID=3079856 RepID=UPI0029142C0B|nr:DUF4129 domain-containing protein [Rhodophyticola sp. MJ-SS7]MDU8942605.1 DUF4129 domain-containing protein [Rhodophyticola sp. MJ-SS7]
MIKSRLALVFVLCLAAPPLAAQSDRARPLDVEMEPAGAAYLETVRWRWLQPEITYFDPDRPAPELTVTPRLPPENTERGDPREIDWTTVMIIVAILLAILALTMKFGSISVIGLRREDGEATVTPGQSDGRPMGDDRIEALEAIRAIADRGEALNRLLAAALSLAARAAGLRLDPSWTVRDAMRRIPASWPFRSQLSQLARDAELAHFGGRPISEDQLERHLQAMVPVFREAGA